MRGEYDEGGFLLGAVVEGIDRKYLFISKRRVCGTAKLKNINKQSKTSKIKASNSGKMRPELRGKREKRLHNAFLERLKGFNEIEPLLMHNLR